MSRLNPAFTVAMGLALAASAGLGLLTGCGGTSGAVAPATSSTQVQVAVTPNIATVPAGSSIQLTAQVSGTSNPTVLWTIDGVANGNATVGTITGSGSSFTYTAPSTAGSHTLTATSAANPADSDSTVLSVTPASGGATTAVALSPSAPTAVGKGGQLTFSATLTGSTGDSVTWSVDAIAGGNATVGTVSAAGVYTCPTVSAQTVHTITATSVANPGVSASVRILATASNTTLNAKTQYGATGDGSTDDTAAINSALAATGSGICLLPAGTYMVNPTAVGGNKGIVLNPGNTLLLAPGAVIQTITQSTTSVDYRTVVMSNLGVCNMAMVGGTVKGDRVARNLPSHSLGHDDGYIEVGEGIGIYNGSGFVLLGVTVQDCCDDGINIQQGSANPSNVVAWDCVSDNNRRQGMSICAGDNMTFTNCTFSNTNGEDPGCGVDLEPSASTEPVTNISFQNCKIFNNKGGGIALTSYTDTPGLVSNVTINGCEVYGNGGQDYGIGGIRCNDGASSATISNNNVHDNLAGADQGGIRIEECSTMVVSGNTVSNNGGYGLFFESADGSTYHGNTGTGNTAGMTYNDGSATAN